MTQAIEPSGGVCWSEQHEQAQWQPEHTEEAKVTPLPYVAIDLPVKSQLIGRTPTIP